MSSVQIRDTLSSRSEPKLQNDIRVFKVLLKYTRCIGVTPLSLEQNSAKRTILKFLTCLLALIYFIFNLTNFILKVKFDRFYNMFFVFIKTLFYVCRTLFVVVTFAKANLLHFHNWRRIFVSLEKLEVMLRDFNFIVKRSCPLLYMDAFVGIIVCVLSRVFHSAVLVYLGDSYQILTVLGWMIFPFYMTSVTTFLYFLAKILDRRYEHLNNVVVELQELNQMVVLSSKLRKMLKVYKKLCLLVEDFNCIFGWQMFLCVVSTFVIVVRLLSRIAIDMNLLGVNMTIVMFLYTTVYLYSLVLFTVTCQSVEDNAKNIVRNCCALSRTVEDYQVQEQLQVLVKQLKYWSPVFSAAGFFNVNRRTLPAVLSAIISYLVLIDQFDLSLQQQRRSNATVA